MRYQSKWSVLHSRYDIVIATNEFFFRYFSRARMIRPLSLANIRRIICWIGGGNSFNSSVKMIFFLSSSLPLWGNKTAGSAFLWNHQIAIISANYLNCQLNSTPRYKVIHFFRYFFFRIQIIPRIERFVSHSKIRKKIPRFTYMCFLHTVNLDKL